MLEDKDTFTLQELFDDLPMPIAELARQSKINEVTLARIRDGRATRRDTANKLLRKFSEIYERPFSLRNVTGINVMVNKRLEKKEARQQAKKEVEPAA
jgi:predicted transcriptional regulator